MHKQIMEFLKGMRPGTRCAIFTLGSKLRFIQGFTEDNSLLLAALNDKKSAGEKDASFQSRSDKADDSAHIAKLMAMIGGRSDAGIDAVREAQAEKSEFQAGERTMMTLEALDYLARYLADVPGRKNLMWFASSFPVIVFPTPAQRQSLNEARVYGSAVKRTADLLTFSKVAVYPINAQGMMNDHWMEGDNAGSGRASGGPGAARGIMGDNSDRADIIANMEQLAADTGGKAFYNTNDLNGAMQRAIHDGSHYYTLVYTPTNKKLDGKYRAIQIKMVEGHYKLAYRRGYNADDSLADVSPRDPDPVRPLLMRGLPPATQVLYGVRVLPQNPQPKPNSPHAGKNPKLVCPCTRYDVDFMIRWTDVSLISTDDVHHHGRIEVGLMAYDHDGNPVNWSALTQGMNLEPDTYKEIQKAGLPAHMEIDLPNSDVYLQSGVYDWNNGKAGTLEVPLHPASSATAASQPGPHAN
jgi:VWFA-related protein